MNKIAGPNDGWRLLLALGISPERRVRSATISIAPHQCPLLTIEEFVQPYNVIGDEIETVMSEYELVNKVEPKRIEAGGINNSGMYQWHEEGKVQ